MNRRNFLALLAAAFTQDPERLLWRPGAKLISIPAITAQDLEDISLKEINNFTVKYLTPQLMDNIFKNSPVFTRLTSRGLTYADFRP